MDCCAGWQSDRERLRFTLTWSPEQILTWLEEANAFSRDIREKNYVLREYH